MKDQESKPKGDRGKKIITIRVEVSNINNNNQKKNQQKRLTKIKTKTIVFQEKKVIQPNLCRMIK